MSNLNFYYCRVILNFIWAMEPLQTWSCISLSAAVTYIYRSSWMVSDLRHEHSLFSMWKRWPFCQPLSRSPAACIPQISPGSWLTFWPEYLTSREELSWSWERMQRIEWGGDRLKKCEEDRDRAKTVWDSQRCRTEVRSDRPLTDGGTERYFIWAFQEDFISNETHSWYRW